MTTEAENDEVPVQRPRLKRTVQVLAWATLLLFGGGGWLLMQWVQGRDPWPLIVGPRTVLFQTVAGLAVGTAMGLLALWLVRRRFMGPVLHRYSALIGPLMTRRSDRLFVSFCAGVGEELFFRGALQHWLGIPVTAILFVAIHGYLDPRNWRISIYGVVMTALMLVLGWMADHWGLLAPMAAHAMIDVVLLEGLHRAWRNAQPSADRQTT